MTEPRLFSSKDQGPRELSPEMAALWEQRQQGLRIVEALLFAAQTPLDTATLQAHLPAGLAAEDLLDELQRHYRFRGINLLPVAGGFSFRTAPDLAALFAGRREEARKLNRAQLETLSIIAYHQPVTRAEIEEIRGVVLHKGTLDVLVEAGWVSPQGRRETAGRPIIWGTTPVFLSHFGLNTLRDLPNLDELRAAGLLDARPVTVLGEGDSEGDGIAAKDDDAAVLEDF